MKKPTKDSAIRRDLMSKKYRQRIKPHTKKKNIYQELDKLAEEEIDETFNDDE